MRVTAEDSPRANMRIRTAIRDDFPALLSLERAAGSAAHWTEAAYGRVFDPDAPRRIALVADDGAVRAFLVARAAGGEWEIENVVVAEPARRQGLGSSLVRHLLALATQDAADAVWLEVRESNAAARALYLRCGFRETGRRRGYYSDPEEDAVLYELVLGSL
jgi:ribosomal-protein-alanine N-acetyltransferase